MSHKITIEITNDLEDRLHIATRHLELSKEEFIIQALEIALNRYEGKYGKILNTGDMTIQAKEGVNLSPSQIGQDEKAEIRNKRRE